MRAGKSHLINGLLGDIYAMGGEPQTALAITTIPFGPEAKVENTLAQMMVGAQRVLNDAGTALVGGHTGEGRELSLGFTVNGLVDRQHILHKSGMCAGNRIILTKPIGIGTLFAADMRSKARGRWIAEALASMCQSNRHGANCLKEFGATACTDLAGFGLLGHLLEMTKLSGVDVEINLGAVPLLDGALELAEAGILSSLHQQNVGQSYAIYDVETAAENPRYPLLFDPQTAGGLMASLPADQADDCIDALHNHGYRHAAIIGTVRQRSNRPEPIVLLS